MVRAEEVDELVAVQVLVHWNHEYVFWRILVVYVEVACEHVGEPVACVGYLVAVCRARLPCVEPAAVNVEPEVAAFGEGPVRPVGILVYLGVQCQLRQYEPCDGACDASIVVAFIVAVAVRQQ